MTPPIDIHPQVVWHQLVWDFYDLSSPAGRLSDPANPVEFTYGIELSNIVSAPCCPAVHYGHGNCVSCVFDESSRPQPSCGRLAYQDGWASVIQALQIGKHPVSPV